MQKLPKKFSFLGFTLVELMVVISIVAVLSAVGVSKFAGASKNANDVKKKTDVDLIAKAYEANYDPTTGMYSAVTAADFSTPIDLTKYSVSITPPAPAFKICAKLGSFTGTCSVSNTNCYCQENSFGKRPTPTATPTNTPTPTSTPTPTFIPVINNIAIRAWDSSNGSCLTYPSGYPTFDLMDENNNILASFRVDSRSHYSKSTAQIFTGTFGLRSRLTKPKIVFTNDSGGYICRGPRDDRNLGVDYIEITVGGVTTRYESESRSTFSYGSWVSDCYSTQYAQQEHLDCGGAYFKYNNR